MKLININPKNLKLSPKHLFRSKKQRSLVSRSDPLSFGSGSSSSSSDDSTHKTPNAAAPAGSQTPTSVLPDVTVDWSDITVDVRWDLAQAFRLIDRDNDGVVSREELEALLTNLAASSSPDDVALMLSEVDGDGHGCISVEALMNRVGTGSEPGSDPGELREAFEVFDTDRDGRISAEELLRVFRAIGDERCTLEECRRMIEGVDRNGDGFVCFEDFSRMMELQR
ncbi:probable calcium-binding protein CML36 [Abrus precatorius]|uniref:Probable calcium-binding protein CML36 n=1 Tax=Abrus precatorius TaxID=3816 RepID=A0A8B8L402_ABRPR|nr:probable calcium-binding protein CML36 [Abrus precatorius]